MAIVTEISWDNMFDGKPVPENPARLAWRAAVAEVAERAKAALPEAVHGRVEKAVQIVLNGDVELLPDGTAKVASQTNGTTQYVVCNGTCECRDFPKAEGGWCKHRASAAIYKRATALAKHKLAQLDEASTDQAEASSQPAPTQPQAAPAVPSTPLPEAPASVNVHIELAGRQVQGPTGGKLRYPARSSNPLPHLALDAGVKHRKFFPLSLAPDLFSHFLPCNTPQIDQNRAEVPVPKS